MNKIITALVLGTAIFIVSGGLDLVNVSVNGYEDKILLMSGRFKPKITASSPVAMMLSVFGFVGAWLISKFPENYKVNKKLADKQELVGMIIFLSVVFLFELTFRIAMS